MQEKKLKNIFVDGAISAQFVAGEILKHNSRKNIGAHSIFLGQIRADVINTETIAAIEFTSYQEMVLDKMADIRQAIFLKYSLTCLHVYHSLGKIKAGEINMFVFASSQHRKDAIEGCAEVVERIKKELPIWGKEIFENADYQWKKNN